MTLSSSTTEWQFANVQTLEPGSQATVTNLGTPTAPILQFGIPRGYDGNVAVLVGNVTVDDLVVNGTIQSGKPGAATGFSGGPLLSQGGWGGVGSTHVLSWAELANGGDNVTGFLTIHVSSKNALKKNGIATVTVVKSLGEPPDLMVTALHASPQLEVFDIGPSGNDVLVTTDAQCSVCWSFIGAT